MKRKNYPFGLLVLTLVPGLSEAKIIVTTTKGDAADIPAISSQDLAQTQFLSSSATGGNDAAANHANLFNGIIGDSGSGTGSTAATTMNNGNTVTINLDVSGNPLGYDITEIDSFFGWNPGANGRSNQGYEVILTFVDDTTATLVGPTHWEPNSPSQYWTTVSFEEEGGGPLFSDTVDLNGGGPEIGSEVTASGVKSITFDITQNANANGVVVGREIDIFGFPTGGVIDALVEVGAGKTFPAVALSTDTTSIFRLGGGTNDSAIISDVDGLSVVMATGTDHTITITPEGPITPGTYPLFGYNGTFGGLGFAGLQLDPIMSSGRPYVASLVNNTGDSRVDVLISAGPEALTWTADFSNFWYQGPPSNWKLTTGGTAENFLSGDLVLFDDTATNGVVTLDDVIEPGAITINNNTLAYTFDGNPILGATGISKQGLGSVTFMNPNTFFGTVDLSEGTIIVGDNGSLGTGPLLNEGTLIANGSGNSNISNRISGSGGLTKNGSGTLSLDDPGANNTFTGDTLINEGTLIAGPGNGDIGLSLNSAVFLGASSGSADTILQFDDSSSSAYPGTIDYVVQSGNMGTASIHGSGYSQVRGTVTLGNANSVGKDLTLAQIGRPEWQLRLQGVIADPVNLTPGSAGDITIGEDNSGRVFYEAVNTYSGNTFVAAGDFEVRPSGSMTFYPTTDGISNQLLGTSPNTGEVTLDAPITLDLGNADSTEGNSWLLIGSAPADFATLTYGVNFGVASDLGSFTGNAGVWTLNEAGNFWTFDQSTGILSVGAAPSNDFDLWASGFLPDDVSVPNADFDSDGLSNFQEYAFGLDPTNSTSNCVAVLDQAAGTLSYTRRTTTGLTYSYGYATTDLTSFIPFSPDAEMTDGGTPIETLTVTLPAALLSNPKFFLQVSAE